MTPFWMAWGMFWIVSCPVKKWDSAKYKEMLLCMPLIGALIGCVWMLVWHLTSWIGLGQNLKGAIMMLVPWCMSGFIHLDGYMDCSDAVLSRRSLEERLRILKDSHVGAFAVITLCILSVVSFGVFSDLDLTGKAWCLIFVPAMSRCCGACAVLTYKPLETSSYARMHAEGIAPGYRYTAYTMTAAFSATAIVIGLLTGSLCGLFTLVQIAAYFITAYYLRKDLSGMSGDISGCAITVSELAGAAALLFL